MADETPQPTKPESPPRFSWRMRLFLGGIIFYMCWQSLIPLTPVKEWIEDFDMEYIPKGLPTVPEMEKLASENDGVGLPPLTDRILESADSLWVFCKPWPADNVRDEIDSWEDSGKYALCWITTRLDFVEYLTGFHQGWLMFSPNARTKCSFVRPRLVYQDDTVRDIHLDVEPKDLTTYHHPWFNLKPRMLQEELISSRTTRLGYCKYLTKKYPKSQSGAPLKQIDLHNVDYEYAEPGEDYLKKMSSQSNPSDWDEGDPVWIYDVKTDEVLPLEEFKERIKERATIEVKTK